MGCTGDQQPIQQNSRNYLLIYTCIYIHIHIKYTVITCICIYIYVYTIYTVIIYLFKIINHIFKKIRRGSMFTPRSLEAWVCFSGGAESKQQAQKHHWNDGIRFCRFGF